MGQQDQRNEMVRQLATRYRGADLTAAGAARTAAEIIRQHGHDATGREVARVVRHFQIVLEASVGACVLAEGGDEGC